MRSYRSKEGWVSGIPLPSAGAFGQPKASGAYVKPHLRPQEIP